MAEKKPQDISFIFFGTSQFSVLMLDALYAKGFVPKLIIAPPDRPAGRKMLLTPPQAKVWAEQHQIPVWQPEHLKDNVAEEIAKRIGTTDLDMGIVVSYGIIIPQAVIDIPQKGILNVHPSLLPHLRGATPIESTILQDEKPGTTIMKIDAKMDHGPIVAQAPVTVNEWPPYREELYKTLAEKSGELLTNSIIPWLEGQIPEREQDHASATFCGKFTKDDMRIDLADDAAENLRKIRAFSGLSYAFFMDHDKTGKDIRVKITRACITDGVLIIERVIPEGTSEMTWNEYATNIRGSFK